MNLELLEQQGIKRRKCIYFLTEKENSNSGKRQRQAERQKERKTEIKIVKEP